MLFYKPEKYDRYNAYIEKKMGEKWHKYKII